MITAHHLVFGRKYGGQSFVFDLGLNTTTVGTVTRTTDHKGGNTAIQFGSGTLESIIAIPSSPVWSFSFWLKSGENSTQNIAIIANNVNEITNNKVFLVALNVLANNGQIGGFAFTHNVSYDNVGRTNGETLMDNQWRHYVVIINTSQPANDEIKIYINKVQKTLVKVNNTNTSYSFTSDKIQIGKYMNNTQATSPIKMFNYALTQTEIDNLYNE